ncbi:MAG: TIGR02281 family clan AA aspartic protease [Methylococcales bacterium]|jgi:aspartyl protease family protein|nr:TIGR02281 family clan AA aspartic protease [Methylococcales bacterium]MBT7444090.1 TIGR02281 family clan AA aspartic protease [Methylococcales bacterium]
MIESNTKKIGFWMFFLFWLMVLGLLVFIFDQVIDYREHPNQSVNTVLTDQQKTVTLKRNRRGHYRVDGMINGQVVTLLVDTGATTVSVSEAFARKVGMPFGRQVLSYTANGQVLGHASRIDKVEVGEIVVRNVQAMILPNLEGDVLLGMSFLKHMDFSQRGQSLILQQRNP